jgi:hypothetical protein
MSAPVACATSMSGREVRFEMAFLGPFSLQNFKELTRYEQSDELLQAEKCGYFSAVDRRRAWVFHDSSTADTWNLILKESVKMTGFMPKTALKFSNEALSQIRTLPTASPP